MDGNIVDGGRHPGVAALKLDLAAPLHGDAPRGGLVAAFRNHPQRATGEDEVQQVPAADHERDIRLVGLAVDTPDGKDHRHHQQSENHEERPADFRESRLSDGFILRRDLEGWLARIEDH